MYYVYITQALIFFSLDPMKSSQRFLGSKDGLKFWWLFWFPAHEAHEVKGNEQMYMKIVVLLEVQPKMTSLKLMEEQQSQARTALDHELQLNLVTI